MANDIAAVTPDGVTIADIVANLPSGRLRAVIGDASIVVAGVTHDSRAVAPGVLFACVVGTRHDGHEFARAAVETGASALLVERELPISAT
jgi:UDP-N-acetylmuramoyl-L-alanyl-D-glutamate--2,6-diaminopimelate ligase